VAVITHAFARPETDYTALPTAIQDQFDQLMEEADIAGPATYPGLMATIALLVGLPNGEIRKCACSCYCGVIFDSNRPDAHVIKHGEGYNLGRHQYPTCADRHRETA